MKFAVTSLGSTSFNSSGLTMLVLAVLWASLFSSVQGTILGQRYGGPVRRPPPQASSHFSFLRPNAFHGSGNPVSIPSPTHAYPIFSRPSQQQQQQQHHQQQQQQHHQPQHQLSQAFHSLAQQLHNHQIRLPANQPIQQQQQQQYSAPPTNNFQPIAGPQNIQQQRPRPQQQSIYYGQPQQQPQQQQVSYNQNIQYQSPSNAIYGQPAQYQSASYYQPQPPTTSNSYLSASSSSNQLTYYPQPPSTPQQQQQASYSVQSQQQVRPAATHFHYNKLNSDAPAGTGTYEPCTSNHWQPIVGAGSSVTPAASAQPASYFSSSVQLTNTRPATSGFRYQPESAASSNKVVVLSHDVLKTLLSNSKPSSNQQLTQSDVGGTKGFVDNVVSSSFVNPTIVPSNSITKVVQKEDNTQPSVKLVGYIGPASQKTPNGYMQIPISKQSLVNLSGSALKNFDLATNASNYSLFTMKSINDIQGLMGAVKSGANGMDQETSASQNIPMGLVVANEQKQQQQETSLKKLVQSDTMFYPVSTGSGSSASSTSGAESNPSVHMVGHVQITSPDVSTHFNKRLDTEETLIATS